MNEGQSKITGLTGKKTKQKQNTIVIFISYLHIIILYTIF